MFKFQESESVELKSAFQSESVCREIVAFLNAHGGTIYLGVKDDRSVVGVTKIDEVMQKIGDILTTQIEPIPSDLVRNSIIFHDGLPIVEISVSQGFHDLYCIKKYGFSQAGCPMRIGTSCRELSLGEIEARYKKRFESSSDYMLQRSSGYGDITFNTLQILLANRGFHINPNSFEQNYHLRNEKGEYNQLAELLSDHNNIPCIFVKFRGKDKSAISERTEYGRCSLITAYMNMKNRLIAENICMTDTTVRPRVDTYLYDMDAVNEARVNAFAHNDWGITEPLICMFEDRLEIMSHGGLPFKQTRENLLKGVSVPRNPGLMRVLQDLEITEQTGHGTPRIVKSYGESAFDINEHFINVVIPFNPAVLKNHGKINGQISGEGLTSNENKVLNTIAANPKATLDEMAKEADLSKRTASRILDSLREKGRVQRAGSKKTGAWLLC